jgi:hypothetical protein
MVKWLTFLYILPYSYTITDRSCSGDCNLGKDNPVANTVISFCGLRSERDICRKVKAGKRHSGFSKRMRFNFV